MATTTTTDKVLDTSSVPYIRSRKIYFSAAGFKPNSKVYAFFDGINVSDYVRQESFVTYSSNPDNTKYTGYTSHPDGSTELIADSIGGITGSFLIPYNSALKFLTGSRTFRLIDNQLNDVNAAYTYADTVYTAKGTLQTHQRTIISVAEPIIVSNPAPVSTPYQAPARPSASISVQGRAPRYVGIPYNLIATASSSTAYGVISKMEVWGRSGNPDASTGTWVLLSSTSPNSYSASAVVRESQNNLAGQYQHKAVITVGANTYESAYQTVNHAALPPELIGVTNDGSSTFYY